MLTQGEAEAPGHAGGGGGRAQVHVARDKDGRKLAVKVQHAGLREMAAVDTLTIEALVEGVRWIFPQFNYQVPWLLASRPLLGGSGAATWRGRQGA